MSERTGKEINDEKATTDAALAANDSVVGFDAIFEYVGGSNRYQWFLLFLAGIQVHFQHLCHNYNFS